MELSSPFIITSRLNAGIKIGNANIEYGSNGNFLITFDNGNEYEITEYQAGPCHSLQDSFADILGFLSAWIDSITYPDGENVDLFPVDNEGLKKWAIENSDEISMLSSDIEENDYIIIDD